MSGGFFRGTSADQDTRFSNKQAKLLKTQKFAPELEHLVDATKVKMDVMRPWIATRVTELLGFEDEVLINFIYGLIEGKVVDGKEIQIQLTGFMEKNTGKFMKELWNLLLSAQKNASGVPQQFLDSKEEELRKKKMEKDSLVQEVQRRKEKGWGPEPDGKSRMDGKADIQEVKDVSKTMAAHIEVKQSAMDDFPTNSKGTLKYDDKRLSARKSRSSPSHSADISPVPSRRKPSPDRSPKSPSNSRSYSGGGHRSRSVSISPRRPRHSDSPERKNLSPRRHQSSPRRHRSPRRRKSPHSRRRSNSLSRHRSPSLTRRSPRRRRSRSPMRHRSRSPFRNVSPSPRYRRSRSPLRRRSPVYVRRRSPSPLRRRSPIRRRSPLRRTSPSPLRRASPPLRSPRSRRSPLQNPRRGYSPPKISSPMHRFHNNLGKGSLEVASTTEFKRARVDKPRMSPSHDLPSRDEFGRVFSGQKSEGQMHRRTSSASPSPQNGVQDQKDILSSVVSKSIILKKSAFPLSGREHKTKQLSLSPSPTRSSRNQKVIVDVPEIAKIENDEERRYTRGRNSDKMESYRQINIRVADDGTESTDGHGRSYRDHENIKGKSFLNSSPTHGLEISHFAEEIEYGPGRVEDVGVSFEVRETTKEGISVCGRKQHGIPQIKSSYAEKHDSHGDGFYNHPKKSKKIDQVKFEDIDADGKEESKYRSHATDWKTSNVEKDYSTDEAGYDSQEEDWKERKRRRKDEKKLRKEEKRRRREEKHRRKEERRASRQKTKHPDGETHSDDGHNHSDRGHNHSAADYTEAGLKVDFKLSDNEETESEQKKLEIKLREKALESLRAKKVISS